MLYWHRCGEPTKATSTPATDVSDIRSRGYSKFWPGFSIITTADFIVCTGFLKTNMADGTSHRDSPVFPWTDDSGRRIRASEETVTGAADILLARRRGSNGLGEGDKKEGEQWAGRGRQEGGGAMGWERETRRATRLGRWSCYSISVITTSLQLSSHRHGNKFFFPRYWNVQRV